MGPRSHPLVSIILPVYNGEKYIASAIDSILGQTYRRFELIVVDDASSDKTIEIVAGYVDRRIRLLRLDCNRGPACARNRGLQAASGQWIGFIDADDCWDENRLTALMDLAARYNRVCVASDILVCLSGRDQQLIPLKSVCQAHGYSEEVIRINSMLEFARSGFDLKPVCPKVVLDRFKIQFNENTCGPEWLEFIFRLFRARLSIVVLNKPLYMYRVTPHSLSSGYKTIKQEIITSNNLIMVPWIDKETKLVILKGRKDIQKRLLSTALREKRWKEAFLQFVTSPVSIIYVFRRIPVYLQERIIARFRG